LLTIQHTPPLDGDWNFLAAQKSMGGMNFLLKKWYYMRPPLFGNRIFLISIRHTPIIEWQLKTMGLMLSFWWKKKSFPIFPS